MTWLVDHPAQLPEDRRAYDTAAEAEHAAWKLEARAVKGVVWWWCGGVENGPSEAAQAPSAAEPIIERVLGHLGLKVPAREAL